MYEYNMVVYSDTFAMHSTDRDFETPLKDLGIHLQEFLDELPGDGWEPVSHSLVAIDDVLVTSVLVRRQLP